MYRLGCLAGVAGLLTIGGGAVRPQEPDTLTPVQRAGDRIRVAFAHRDRGIGLLASDLLLASQTEVILAVSPGVVARKSRVLQAGFRR